MLGARPAAAGCVDDVAARGFKLVSIITDECRARKCSLISGEMPYPHGSSRRRIGLTVISASGTGEYPLISCDHWFYGALSVALLSVEGSISR